MGCVESSRRVKTIRVVQQAANGVDFRRGSKGLLSGCRPPRTPLPNLVDSGFEDELTAIATIDLGESFDSRHSSGSGAVRPSGLSPDSGIFELIGSEFSGVITDFPEPETVPRMQNEFRIPGPYTELLNGSACPPRVSALRREEAVILNRLQQEGLITKPKATTSGGVSYELVAKSDEPIFGPGGRLPPIKLKKLEKRRSKHRAKTPHNEEQIFEKLEKAEERRKEAELEKSRRINERISSAKPRELRQLENMAKVQKHMERFETTLEKRALYLQNVREKLREHNQKAAVVRLRKAKVREDLSSQDGLDEILREHGNY